ncbi:CBO0543 family protein [Paenibacillus nasutitermitis]|uniref:Uncharacterized protein n=1 Tax=Paenibacillus nasutitermitis TaxID=1652958 RepID=A0A917E035_9BACL|nr:CBO0543 family protein [Paenibacillus nasutitermitis]GGD86233.1 hypothetical protein GCM10010911_50810 [Paenibacillus nasutitermitis]
MAIKADHYILMAVNTLCIIAFLLVPPERRREAHVIVLFHQLITWILGIFAVEWGLLAYPVRMFHIGSHTSITFEYIAYPVIAVYFNLIYPAGVKALWQTVYYMLVAMAIVVPELWFKNHTELIMYLHWFWYWTWLSVMGTLWMTRMFYTWFFRTTDTGKHRIVFIAEEPVLRGSDK